MNEPTLIAIDVAKNVFQLCELDSPQRALDRCPWRRDVELEV